MEDCNCIKAPKSSENAPINTSDVINYDGSPLCNGISSGTLNEVLKSITDTECTDFTILQNLINGIKDSTLPINEDFSQSCIGSVSTQGALNVALVNLLCSTSSKLSGILLDGTHVNGGMVLVGNGNYPINNCCGVLNTDNIRVALFKIISKLCPQHIGPPSPYSPPVFADFFGGGILSVPLNSFVKGILNCTHQSGAGVSAIEVLAANYYVDSANISKNNETITLSNNADNYLFLDNTNNFDWNVSAVPIRNPAPTTNGIQIAKVQTGDGGIVSYSQLIANYPIDNSLIADSSITARNLKSTDIINTSGGLKLENDGTISANLDNTSLETYNAGDYYKKIRVKAGGIDKSAIASNVAGSGLKQNIDGSLSTNVDKSIVINGNNNELANDEVSPAANSFYGTDKNESKGWQIKDLNFIRIDVTNDQFKVAASNPILLLTCPVGSIMYIEDAAFYLKYGSIAYTPDDPADTVSIGESGWVAAVDALFSFTNNAIIATGDYFERVTKNGGKFALNSGESLYLSTIHDTIVNEGGNYGNSPVYIYLWYKEIILPTT